VALSSPNPWSPDLWHALEDLRSSRRYESGSVLFRDGEPCAGIYLIEKGQINLLLPTQKKRYELFEAVGRGAMLGLSEAMSGSPHKFMAEAGLATEVAYVERMALMKFLSEHHMVCMQVVRLLSEDLHALYHRFREASPLQGRPRKLPANPLHDA